MNPVANNPVYTKDAATLLIWVAAKYGFHLSVSEATAIAGTFFTLAAPFVRQLVTPTAKLEYKVEPTPPDPLPEPTKYRGTP